MHDLTVFPEALRAGRAGQVIELTARDLRILALLHERAGRPVSKDELYDAAWGRNYMPNSRALEQYILSLRRKLEVSPDLPPVIETVHGHGYRFDPQSRG